MGVAVGLARCSAWRWKRGCGIPSSSFSVCKSTIHSFSKTAVTLDKRWCCSLKFRVAATSGAFDTNSFTVFDWSFQSAVTCRHSSQFCFGPLTLFCVRWSLTTGRMSSRPSPTPVQIYQVPCDTLHRVMDVSGHRRSLVTRRAWPRSIVPNGWQFILRARKTASFGPPDIHLPGFLIIGIFLVPVSSCTFRDSSLV
jgi:hypothetical protein